MSPLRGIVIAANVSRRTGRQRIDVPTQTCRVVFNIGIAEGGGQRPETALSNPGLLRYIQRPNFVRVFRREPWKASVDVLKPCQGLRVALISGTLGQGGAEKQVVYIARALRDAGADVKVYSMRPGEFHEPILKSFGFEVFYLGDRSTNPFLRLAVLLKDLSKFRPHVVQSGHFWANFYSGIAGRLRRAVAVGALRSTLQADLRDFSPWGPWLLRLPTYLLANSQSAKRAAEAYGLRPGRTLVLPNAIDLEQFDALHLAASRELRADAGPVVVAVGRLVPAKRFDRFIKALASARHRVKNLSGLLIGDGPERPRLEQQARQMALLPYGLRFTGRRDDVPALLAHADVLALSSDDEGFPNVLLEAMTARLPVVTTPAGDAAEVVDEGVTGFVVPFEDSAAMTERFVRLAETPELRQRMGEAGRRRVEERFSLDELAGNLVKAYCCMAEQSQNRELRRILCQ